MTGN
ncbi:hypothetical protein EYF80_059602 [Liparis tanakae]|jgi:hypothetical protein